MCCQKDNFLSKIKPRYFQVSLGQRIGPLIKVRSRRGGLNRPKDLEKWKTSDFLCLMMRLYCLRKDKIIL